MNTTKAIIFVLLNIACLVNVALWPVNQYEWMLLDEPDMILPIDDKAFFYLLFAGLPIPMLLLFLTGTQSKKSKLTVAIDVSVLFGIWLFKYRSIFFG
jgi:hypothetical protein